MLNLMTTTASLIHRDGEKARAWEQGWEIKINVESY